jgi:alkylation response protein AidB-like acyl-CoA dehydrogenase
MHDMVRNDLPEWLRRAPLKCPDPRTTARSLRSLIEANAAEADTQRSLPEPVTRALAASGLFGMLVPKELGGMEVDPATYIDVIDELSYADGSTGWVVLATTYCMAGASVWLGPTAIDAMYRGTEGPIACGQIAPLGKAIRIDGGYRVSGTQQFGSGSQIASWFLGCFVVQKDGAPDLDANGRPKMIWAYAPRSRIRLRGNWDVVGLRATASYDFEFIDQFVPDDFVIALPMTERPRGGAIYDIPATLAHAAWAIGMGRRALDEIKQIASHKRRQGRTTLIDQPTFQRDFADAVASMEAARLLVHSTFNKWFEAGQRGTPDIDIRARGRLSGCWVTKVAAEVGRFAYLAAGSDGLRNSAHNRIQRCFRDLQVGATHRHVDHNVEIDSGAVLLGVNAPDVDI